VRPARLSGYIGAAALAGLSSLLAAWVLLQAPEDQRAAQAREVRGLVAEAILPIVAEVRMQRDQAAILAAGMPQIGVDDPDGPSADAAALARDTGLPALDSRAGGQFVIARYQPSDPVTVLQRRSTLVGYTLVPLSISGLLERYADDRAVLSLQARGTEVATSDAQGRVDLGPEPETYSVALADVAAGWRLEASLPASGLSWVSVAFAAAMIGGGLLGGVLLLRRSQRSVADEIESRLAASADSALNELSTVARDSLELAEVLPASAAVLESTFGVAGLSLLTAGGRPTFAWGEIPRVATMSARDVLAAGQSVPAGSAVDFVLSRGGRSLGTLRMLAGRELAAHEVTTLAQAMEILSASVANADAYQHQRELIARMRRLDDLKTVFVATASHELRTPVAAISGFASMLNEGWDTLEPAAARIYADRVDSNARRLASLVEHLLDFSRLEQGGAYSGERVVLDLGDEVRGLVASTPDLAGDHQVSVRADPGVAVMGSGLAIERVLTNLVGNAAKYSPAGSTIWIRVHADESGAHLSVDDEGPGVAAAEREAIFSRFFRGTGDEVVRTRGAGLGLSIVQEFAGSMDGRVSVSEAPGGGARFTVTYPQASAAQKAPAPPTNGVHHGHA
jgi:signal transduction histidine kinase